MSFSRRHFLLDLSQLHWRQRGSLRRVVIWIAFLVVDTVIGSIFIFDRKSRIVDLDDFRNVRQFGCQNWGTLGVDLVSTSRLYLVDPFASCWNVDEALCMTMASWGSLSGWSFCVTTLKISGRWSHGSIFIRVYLCWPAALAW